MTTGDSSPGVASSMVTVGGAVGGGATVLSGRRDGVHPLLKNSARARRAARRAKRCARALVDISPSD